MFCYTVVKINVISVTGTEDDVLACRTKLLTVGKEAIDYCVICEQNDFAVHSKTIKRPNVIFFLATQLPLAV
jgi:hypothetical protein